MKDNKELEAVVNYLLDELIALKKRLSRLETAVKHDIRRDRSA